MLDPVSIPFLVCVVGQLLRAAGKRDSAEVSDESGDVLGAALGFGASVGSNFTHELAKTAWTRVNEKLARGATPANHDVMRAVRRATLRAGLSFSQQWRLRLQHAASADPEWRRQLDVWLHAELDRVDASDYDLPAAATPEQVELLFRHTGADPDALADLQARLTENFLAELRTHTASGRIPVAEEQTFNPVVPAAFVALIAQGCPFLTPDPGLLAKAKNLL